MVSAPLSKARSFRFKTDDTSFTVGGAFLSSWRIPTPITVNFKSVYGELIREVTSTGVAHYRS